jgi:hypothetical protein
MIKNALIGRSVAVRENDFVSVSTDGCVEYVDPLTDSILIRLDAPSEIGGRQYRLIVARPRLARDNLETLIDTGVLGCGLTWIPDDEYDVRNPVDLSWWRGGGTAVADIVLKQ